MSMNEIPKVVTFLCAQSNEIQRCTYILRNPVPPTGDAASTAGTTAGGSKLTHVLTDLRLLFRLPPLSTTARPLIICDAMQAGQRVKSFNDLYFSPSCTFVLTSAEEKDADLAKLTALLQHSDIKRTNASKKPPSSAGQSGWAIGANRLKRSPSNQDVAVMAESSTDQPRPTMATSRIPRVATMQTQAQRQRNAERAAQNEAHELQNKGKKPVRQRSKSKTKTAVADGVKVDKPVESAVAEPVEEVVKQPEIIEPPPAPPPAPAKTRSQIEAQLARVKDLQDKMAEGPSFLDRIGRGDDVHTRRATGTLFGPIAEAAATVPSAGGWPAVGESNIDTSPLPPGAVRSPAIQRRPLKQPSDPVVVVGRNGSTAAPTSIPGWTVLIDDGKKQDREDAPIEYKPPVRPGTVTLKAATVIQSTDTRISTDPDSES